MMLSSPMTIHLDPNFFSESEKRLIVTKGFEASLFKYQSGVCAVRMKNEVGEIIMLPYQGQQIWSAEFYKRNLTMKSMFSQPFSSTDFLRNFGAFFLHCGATAMGGPSKEDTHPLHGELPNAHYQSAFLCLGEDQHGQFIGLGGQYQHIVAFSFNYIARPLVKLYHGSGLVRMELKIQNLKNTPMELMYLAHINFQPVDQARLVYSAIKTPEHVRVRASIPAHIHPQPGYPEFLQELKNDPKKHHILEPGLGFDPEVVFFIDYLTDEEGWAHTMQVLPDGSADYVRHRPDQLNKATRWICRTPDQDALGMVEPGTAEPEGYLAEKAKGNLQVVPAGGKFYCVIEMGALNPDQATQVEQKIEEIVVQYT